VREDSESLMYYYKHFNNINGKRTLIITKMRARYYRKRTRGRGRKKDDDTEQSKSGRKKGDAE